MKAFRNYIKYLKKDDNTSFRLGNLGFINI